MILMRKVFAAPTVFWLPLRRIIELSESLSLIFHIFTRIRNLMLHPAEEWETVASECSSRKTVYVRFVVPLLCLISVAVIIGTWLDTPREMYSVPFVFSKIAVLWTSLSMGLYFSTFIITELMARQVDSKDHDLAFALMAYASGAALLVLVVVELFPFFNELLVLAFYSCYLYWRGIPRLIRVHDRKRMMYALVSSVIVVLMYLLMFFFFGNILRAIFTS